MRLPRSTSCAAPTAPPRSVLPSLGFYLLYQGTRSFTTSAEFPGYSSGVHACARTIPLTRLTARFALPSTAQCCKSIGGPASARGRPAGVDALRLPTPWACATSLRRRQLAALTGGVSRAVRRRPPRHRRPVPCRTNEPFNQCVKFYAVGGGRGPRSRQCGGHRGCDHGGDHDDRYAGAEYRSSTAPARPFGRGTCQLRPTRPRPKAASPPTAISPRRCDDSGAQMRVKSVFSRAWATARAPSDTTTIMRRTVAASTWATAPQLRRVRRHIGAHDSSTCTRTSAAIEAGSAIRPDDIDCAT